MNSKHATVSVSAKLNNDLCSKKVAESSVITLVAVNVDNQPCNFHFPLSLWLRRTSTESTILGPRKFFSFGISWQNLVCGCCSSRVRLFFGWHHNRIPVSVKCDPFEKMIRLGISWQTRSLTQDYWLQKK